jgi:hypothetical protein
MNKRILEKAANMKKEIPRQYSLVKFDFDALDEKYHSQMPFTRKGVYIFFGEEKGDRLLFDEPLWGKKGLE